MGEPKKRLLPGLAGSLYLEEAVVLRREGPASCRLRTEPGEPWWRVGRSPGWATGHQPEGLALLGYDELLPCKVAAAEGQA